VATISQPLLVQPPPIKATAAVTALAVRGQIADLPANNRTWFKQVPPGKSRDVANQAVSLRVPQADAGLALLGLIRFVADIPADASLTVVWQSGRNELMVDCGSVALRCDPGLITVGLSVQCDQVQRTRVIVPFAVGTSAAPRGLYLSTIDRLDAPAEIAEAWSDPIIAFCWEALLELAQRVCGQIGTDAQQRPLVPATLAADAGMLVLTATARPDLSGLIR
jgi:hypothetical protein